MVYSVVWSANVATPVRVCNLMMCPAATGHRYTVPSPSCAYTEGVPDVAGWYSSLYCRMLMGASGRLFAVALTISSPGAIADHAPAPRAMAPAWAAEVSTDLNRNVLLALISSTSRFRRRKPKAASSAFSVSPGLSRLQRS